MTTLLESLVGYQLQAVDRHPECEGLILTVRPMGSRACRHVAVVVVNGRLAVSEVYAGSKVLRAVAAQRDGRVAS